MSALSCIWNQLAQTAAVNQTGQGETPNGERESERREIYRNGDEGEVWWGGGDGWWGLFTERIIHYFFLPQYFLSLICLLFFKLDPEPCPPAESLAQRRGGLGQLQASLEPCAQRWRGWGRGRESRGVLWWMEAETQGEKEADAAWVQQRILHSKTQHGDPERLSFKARKRAEDFSADSLPHLRPSKNSQQQSSQDVTRHIYTVAHYLTARSSFPQYTALWIPLTLKTSFTKGL